MDFRKKDGHTFPLTPTHPALSSHILNNNTESNESKKSRLNRLHNFAKKKKSDFNKTQKEKKEAKNSERLQKIKEMQSGYLKIIESSESDESKLLLLNSLKNEYSKFLKHDKLLASKIDKAMSKLTEKEAKKEIEDNENEEQRNYNQNRHHNNRQEQYWDKFPTKSGELLDVGKNSKITTRDILMLQSAGIIDPEIVMPDDDEE